MSRKPITDTVQNAIFIKSRRRCCLCFWLEGKDEVVKGQLAHLDQDNENNSEENLVFLCLAHHDEYDSTTRLSKGLRETEVRRWRNELYREMEYRFRSILKHGCELTFRHFVASRVRTVFGCALTIKNTGESAVKHPTLTVKMPAFVTASFKRPYIERPFDRYLSPIGQNDFDMWAPQEQRLDVFEPQGRVLTYRVPGISPILMPGHTDDFEGLAFKVADVSEMQRLEFEYRIDYSEGTPSLGVLSVPIPDSHVKWIISTDMGNGLPSVENAVLLLKSMDKQ